MVRRKLSNLLIGSVLFLGVNFFDIFNVLGFKQEVKSPEMFCSSCFPLKDKGKSSFLNNISVEFDLIDGQLSIFAYDPLRNYFLPEDESLFVVLKDRDSKKEVGRQYLNRVQPFGYEGSLKMEYYHNALEVEFYKQNNKDPQYYINPDNCIGEFRVFTACSGNFLRGNKKQLTVLDKDGNIINNKTAYLINSIIPNYYTLQFDPNDNSLNFKKFIGQIILPKEQEHLLKSDEKIYGLNYYSNFLGAGGAEILTNFKYCFNLYIPKGVSNVKFQIYGDKITNNREDVLYQFDINLNKS